MSTKRGCIQPVNKPSCENYAGPSTEGNKSSALSSTMDDSIQKF